MQITQPDTEPAITSGADAATEDVSETGDALVADTLPEVIMRFVQMYQHLDKDNLHLLPQVYSDDICFRDPLHQVNGITALTNYFADMYQNVQAISFNIHSIKLVDGNAAQASASSSTSTQPEAVPPATDSLETNTPMQEACLFWTMTYQHSKLNNGQPITVDGMSRLQFQQKIHFHRDYFDAGQMLYQHVPLLGRVINWLKNRVASAWELKPYLSLGQARVSAKL